MKEILHCPFQNVLRINKGLEVGGLCLSLENQSAKLLGWIRDFYFVEKQWRLQLRLLLLWYFCVNIFCFFSIAIWYNKKLFCDIWLLRGITLATERESPWKLRGIPLETEGESLWKLRGNSPGNWGGIHWQLRENPLGNWKEILLETEGESPRLLRGHPLTTEGEFPWLFIIWWWQVSMRIKEG